MINLNNLFIINVACTKNFKNDYKVVYFNIIDRKQDAEFTRKKKNLIAVRKSAQNRTIKIARPQITKKQDHSTLLNPTEVWREKCRIPDPNIKESKKLQYIKDVPHLYVFLTERMLIFTHLIYT